MAFFLPMKGVLVLEDRSCFEGELFSKGEGPFFGEAVFTTGMVGYVETLTDPSYAGQIIVFTYPLIGNYGVPAKERWESTKIHAKGVVVSEAVRSYSHRESLLSLFDWLEQENIPLLSGVDTRALTKRLRVHGTMSSYIARQGESLPRHFVPPGSFPVADVSIKEKVVEKKGKKRLVLVDCGMKGNILRELLSFDLEIIRVPYNYDYIRDPFDAILVSNGPGDPADCMETIAILRQALQMKKPIFGICLGLQLLALAAGAKTYKLKFGHRGQNQPCMELASGRCFLTSQNHGYAVEEESLGSNWQVTYRNLNDQSIEGITHKSFPFSAVQFHPEASPGPREMRFLFEEFVGSL